MNPKVLAIKDNQGQASAGARSAGDTETNAQPAAYSVSAPSVAAGGGIPALLQRFSAVVAEGPSAFAGSTEEFEWGNKDKKRVMTHDHLETLAFVIRSRTCDSAHCWHRSSMLKAVTLCAAASAAAFAPTSVPQRRR